MFQASFDEFFWRNGTESQGPIWRLTLDNTITLLPLVIYHLHANGQGVHFAKYPNSGQSSGSSRKAGASNSTDTFLDSFFWTFHIYQKKKTCKKK